MSIIILMKFWGDGGKSGADDQKEFLKMALMQKGYIIKARGQGPWAENADVLGL